MGIGKSKGSSNKIHTLIGEGTFFKGNLESNSGMRIEGRLEGSVTCHGDVFVGRKGRVHSSIAAENLIISGVVEGNVTISGKLWIQETGRLAGDAIYGLLQIDPGGVVEGTCKVAVRDERQMETNDPKKSREKEVQ